LQVRIRIPRGPSHRVPAHSLASEPAAPPAVAAPATPRIASSGSSRVAFGILLSRLTGLIRERAIAHYFGDSAVADAFGAAIRIPNLLNNLFGEGVLSASFVTVYSKLRALQKDQEAEHVAAAVLAVLSLACSVLVLLGILLTPLLVEVIAPGFSAGKRDLTIQIVRITFPGTGLLVLSAWCLGVLNSHRRFLLSYTAPVAMNIIMIAALLAFGRRTPEDRLVLDLAWAFVLGSALQCLVQIPRVLQLLPGIRPRLDIASPHVRAVFRNFGPIFLSRGVVQVSAFLDSIIGSYLPAGAVAQLRYAQIISVLPISLFSMSVSAAELPVLSSGVGTQQEVAAFLRVRLIAGLRRIAFFVVPSAIAFLALGDVIAAGLYQSGRFHHQDAVYVWSILAGSAVGLLATSLGRLYSSAFYALLDTRTPLRFAVVRVALTIVLGVLFALPLPRWLGIDPRWGVAGLSASAGLAGWVEFSLLRRALRRRIGSTPLAPEFTLKLWSAAVIAAAFSYSVKLLLGTAHPKTLAVVVLPLYAALYFAVTWLLGIEESLATFSGILRRLRRS
jgi:putative peptidoglycan lipid II flippase